MKVVKYKPKFPLDNLVDCVLYLENNNKGTGLPKTNMSLVFNLRDSFKLYSDRFFSSSCDYDKYWIAGLQTRPNFVESYGESKMIVVQFKTIGVHHFFSEPLHNFTNRYVRLDDVCSIRADETWEKLAESTSVRQMFRIVEEFLLSNMFTPKSQDDRLVRSVQLISKTEGTGRVASLCRETGVSRKHLNFLFKEFTGVSPKTLSAFYRFQKALRTLSLNRPKTLTEFAYDLEYFDQAHFIYDFKRFAGLTPTQYLNLAAANSNLQLIPHFLPSV